jgi:trans-2-enoyl-CoA reductase
MNKITELFVDHLRHSSALEDVEAWVQALEKCDESPEGTKAATFTYMAAIQRELLVFVGTIDIAGAAVQLQA